MSKIYQSYETLLLFLQNEKNLKLEDMEAARHILKKTSYFSLITGYKDIFKNPTTGKYIDGTSFEHIYRLYQFDHELRNVFLKYILIAERSVKSSLAYHFTSAYGENQLQYLSKDNYMLSSSNQKAIQKLINIFSFQLERNREYAYMNHYRNKYHNVPLWIMVQVLTVGQIAHMFDYLKSTVTIKICIDHHNIGIRDMHSFLSILTKHRNVCAHGDRFFNYITKDSITDTPIHKKLHIPQINGRYQHGKNDLFSEVIILKYLLDRGDFRDFYYELKHCIKKYLPDETILWRMGFPENWMSVLRLKM